MILPILIIALVISMGYIIYLFMEIRYLKNDVTELKSYFQEEEEKEKYFVIFEHEGKIYKTKYPKDIDDILTWIVNAYKNGVAFHDPDDENIIFAFPPSVTKDKIFKLIKDER